VNIFLAWLAVIVMEIFSSEDCS